MQTHYQLEKSNDYTKYLIDLMEPPKEYLDDIEQKWFINYQSRTETINAVIRFLFNEPLSSVDEMHLFSYLLLHFEKNNDTDNWPADHPLQAQNYIEKMKSNPEDAVSLGFTSLERKNIFPIFLKMERDLQDLGVKLMEEAEAVKELLTNPPQSYIANVKKILLKLKSIAYYGDFLTLQQAIRNEHTPKKRALKLQEYLKSYKDMPESKDVMLFSPLNLTNLDTGLINFSNIDLAKVTLDYNQLTTMTGAGENNPKSIDLFFDSKQLLTVQTNEWTMADEYPVQNSKEVLKLVLYAIEHKDEILLRILLQDNLKKERSQYPKLQKELIKCILNLHLVEFEQSLIETKMHNLKSSFNNFDLNVLAIDYQNLFQRELTHLKVDREDTFFMDQYCLVQNEIQIKSQGMIIEECKDRLEDLIIEYKKHLHILYGIIREQAKNKDALHNAKVEKIALLEYWVNSNIHLQHSCPKAKANVQAVSTIINPHKLDSEEGKARLFNANIDPSKSYSALQVRHSDLTENRVDTTIFHLAAQMANKKYDHSFAKIIQLLIARGANPWKLNNAEESMESIAKEHILYSALVKMPFPSMVNHANTSNDNQLVFLQDIIQKNSKWQAIVNTFVKMKLALDRCLKTELLKTYKGEDIFKFFQIYGTLIAHMAQLQPETLLFEMVEIQKELKLSNSPLKNSSLFNIFNTCKHELQICLGDRRQIIKLMKDRESAIVASVLEPNSILVKQDNYINYLEDRNERLQEENIRAQEEVKTAHEARKVSEEKNKQLESEKEQLEKTVKDSNDIIKELVVKHDHKMNEFKLEMEIQAKAVNAKIKAEIKAQAETANAIMKAEIDAKLEASTASQAKMQAEMTKLILLMKNQFQNISTEPLSHLNNEDERRCEDESKIHNTFFHSSKIPTKEAVNEKKPSKEADF